MRLWKANALLIGGRAAGEYWRENRERPELGDVAPDQQGISDQQLTSDPAIGNNAGKARSGAQGSHSP
jgi:hypothetical protein